MTSDPLLLRTLIDALPPEIEFLDDSTRLTLELHAGNPHQVVYASTLNRGNRVVLHNQVFTGLSVLAWDDGRIGVLSAFDERRQRPAIAPDLNELEATVKPLWAQESFNSLRVDMLRVRTALQ